MTPRTGTASARHGCPGQQSPRGAETEHVLHHGNSALRRVVSAPQAELVPDNLRVSPRGTFSEPGRSVRSTDSHSTDKVPLAVPCPHRIPNIITCDGQKSAGRHDVKWEALRVK